MPLRADKSLKKIVVTQAEGQRVLIVYQPPENCGGLTDHEYLLPEDDAQLLNLIHQLQAAYSARKGPVGKDATK